MATEDDLRAELERLRGLLRKCEFLWGGFCPWCGCHGRHDCYENSPCPAFSAPGVVREGPPPPSKFVPYDASRNKPTAKPPEKKPDDPEKDRH